jgi:hypothetical protein
MYLEPPNSRVDSDLELPEISETSPGIPKPFAEP